MSDFAPNFLRDKLRNTGGSQVYVGACGKHPAWNDYIDFKAATESMAVAKSILVQGALANLKMDAAPAPEPAFDHLFLWSREDQVLVGTIQDSVDGIGRKFPLFVLSHLIRAGEQESKGMLHYCGRLERLLKSTRTTQEFESILQANPPGSFESGADDQPLLEHGNTSESRLRLIYYDIKREFSGYMQDRPLDKKNLPSRHIRLPRLSPGREEALLFWNRLLGALLHPSVPRLIIAGTQEFVDVILGEPASNNFRCLQGSREHFPVAGETPYTLEPSTLAEAKTLFEQVGGPVKKATSQFMAPPPDVSRIQPAPVSAGNPRRSPGKFILVGIGIVVLSVLGVWFFSSGREKRESLTRNGDQNQPVKTQAQSAINLAASSNSISSLQVTQRKASVSSITGTTNAVAAPASNLMVAKGERTPQELPPARVELILTNENARVFLNGKPVQTRTFELEPGGNLITVSAPGIDTWKTNLLATNGQQLVFKLDLPQGKAPANQASIETNAIVLASTNTLPPGKSAETNAGPIPPPILTGKIVIEGITNGVSLSLDETIMPFTNQLSVPPGPHRLVAIKEGWPEWRTNIVVSATQAVQIQIHFQPVEIVFSCNLAQTEVRLAGATHEVLGLTSFTNKGELKPGKYQFEFRPSIAYFASSNVQREIKPGRQEININFPYETVNLSSTPPGAEVFLKDKWIGRTPTNQVILPANEVLLFKRGTNIVRKKVEGTNREPLRISADFSSFTPVTPVLANPSAPSNTIVPLKPNTNISSQVIGGIPNTSWTNRNGMILQQVTSNLWVGKYEVTEREYSMVMSNASVISNLPVRSIPPSDALVFCTKLTELEKGMGPSHGRWHYDLPTFEQWRMLAKAHPRATNKVKPSSTVENSKSLREVGKTPWDVNAHGIHDLHGNVGELCKKGSEVKYEVGGTYERSFEPESGPREAKNRDWLGFRVVLYRK